MMRKGSAMGRKPSVSGATAAPAFSVVPAAVEPELVGLGLEGRDHEGDVVVEVHAELLGPTADVLAVDGRGEGGRLELLLDRLRRHPVDALGPHVRAGRDEAA